MSKMSILLKKIRACKECKAYLPLKPRPILSAHPSAKILIIGQAPGIRVHETGVPWNDPSGDRLREWFEIDRDTFYDDQKIAIVPMGFCYPGTGKSGDLPPRKECAPLWHEKIFALMPNIKLTLLLGKYAQGYYLGDKVKDSLTETVKAWKTYWPKYLPLPHPSPRNNIWLKKNPWFNKNLIPQLRKKVHQCL